MKTKLLLVSLLTLTGFSTIHAQCAAISCPSDINVNVGSASCDAIVSFTDPVGIDTCNFITSTYSYTGTEQTYVVPVGVTTIIVDAYGAQGGANWVSNDNFGGHVKAELAVTPGTTIFVYVGEQPNGIVGGWNGGGNGETAGQGGGGASDIRIGGNTLTDRVVVAGAGGGGGYWSGEHVIGGKGGDLIGGNGMRTDFVTAPGGEGGTQSASANGTCASLNNPVCAGGFGFGGAPTGCGCEVYGGGGGWYGGGGSGNCRGGGGGSSYTIPSATNVVHNQGVRVGHGEITISYPSNAGVSTSQIAGLVSGSAFPVGITTNTFQVVAGTDTTWCSFDIVVSDSIIPTITAPSDVETCEGIAVNNIAPIVSDNCTSLAVTYTVSGSTSGNGTTDASGTIFNPGVSTIWYYVTDNAGNMDSTSMMVTTNTLPVVTLAALTNDSLCLNNNPITVPAGTPSSGTYSGNGVSGVYFDPSLSGIGTHYILYTYSDSNGCMNSDSVAVVVDDCVGLNELSSTNQISIYPNPTKDNISVTLSSKGNSILYSLYTAEGKSVFNGTQSGVLNFDLDLSQEEIGIYFLHVNVDGISSVVKILKQ